MRVGHTYTLMAAAAAPAPAQSNERLRLSAKEMHASLSGADQLKEERQRFVAATAQEAAQDYWGDSSDEELADLDRSPRPPPVPVHAISEELVSTANSGHGADLQALACYSQLPGHATVVAAVKGVMQQHGTVRPAA